MPSKFDRLRSGEVVEIEPGRKGRLNLQDKSFETSDGRKMYVGDDPDFFPSGESALAYSREKEGLQKEIKQTPGGEFLYQFGNQGIAGATKDWYNKLSKKGDDYLRSKQINQEVSQGISEQSPWTSAAATGASFVPDIALTHGMSALKAAPALTGLHAGPRILEEPAAVAGEAALSAAGGFLIDKGASALSRIAKRRGQIRSLPGQQASVIEQNELGQLAAKQANEAGLMQHKQSVKNVKDVNQMRLAQHDLDLVARENAMIQSQQDYLTKKATRDAEVLNLKNQYEAAKVQRTGDQAKLAHDYKIAKQATDSQNALELQKYHTEKSNYDALVKKTPELQRAAQAEHGKNVVETAKEIERSFPKTSTISTDDLHVANFIEDSIDKTGLGGSREANQAKRFLQSVFPEGEILSGREISKGYKAIEEAIQRSSPEVQTILNDFKAHLGQRLPAILEDSVVHSRIVPLLKKTLKNDVKTILNEITFVGTGSDKVKNHLMNLASSNADNLIKRNIQSGNFISRMQSGELANEIARKVVTVEDFLPNLSKSNIQQLNKEGLYNIVFDEAKRKHAYFVEELTQNLQKKFGKYEIKALEVARNESKKAGQAFKKTIGLAEPVPSPVSPVKPMAQPYPTEPAPLAEVAAPQIPPQIQQPGQLSKPSRPNLMNEPSPPTPQAFNPLAEPSLPPAQGISDMAGDLLEKKLLGGNTLANNSLTKLAGLKYLLGKSALPAEAGYGALKGLTSPTAAGEAARMTFKQGGIQAIQSWMQKYPSFHNGILENPQDRRSLTKEIEDDYEIPIEQKAIIQSKVNRGMPLQARL